MSLSVQDILFNICFLFISIELMTHSTITHAWVRFSDTYFLHKAHHSVLVLRNTRQDFSITFGAILNSKITHRKYKNVRNVALNRTGKGCLYAVMKAEVRKQTTAFFILSWELVHQVTPACCHCARAWMTAEALWVLVFGLLIISVRRQNRKCRICK